MIDSGCIDFCVCVCARLIRSGLVLLPSHAVAIVAVSFFFIFMIDLFDHSNKHQQTHARLLASCAKEKTIPGERIHVCRMRVYASIFNLFLLYYFHFLFFFIFEIDIYKLIFDCIFSLRISNLMGRALYFCFFFLLCYFPFYFQLRYRLSICYRHTAESTRWIFFLYSLETFLLPHSLSASSRDWKLWKGFGISEWWEEK